MGKTKKIKIAIWKFSSGKLVLVEIPLSIDRLFLWEIPKQL